jgi:hypothetical protein
MFTRSEEGLGAHQVRDKWDRKMIRERREGIS